MKGRLYSLLNNSALYQGTTLVGPHPIETTTGFSP